MEKKRNIIKLSESQLMSIISESVKRVLNEGYDISEKFPPGFIAKKGREWAMSYMSKKYPDLDPAGFIIIGDAIKSNGKKKQRGGQSVKIAKPAGMDDIEYITKFAPKYNKRLAAGLDKLKEYSNGEEEQWEPLDVGHLRGDEVAEEFSNRYYISNFGGIALSNPSHTGGCHVFVPYFDRSTKQFQINLRIYDSDGKEMDHLCPSVVNLVRRVFGDGPAMRLRDFELAKLNHGEAIMSGEETDF